MKDVSVWMFVSRYAILVLYVVGDTLFPHEKDVLHVCQLSFPRTRARRRCITGAGKVNNRTPPPTQRTDQSRAVASGSPPTPGSLYNFLQFSDIINLKKGTYRVSDNDLIVIKKK